MFPFSQKDMHKFCCDRSTCSNRNPRKEDSSLSSSSAEEIYKKVEQNISWNKIDKETQKTPTVTTSSSEKSNRSASEYEIIINTCRQRSKSKKKKDMRHVYEQMECSHLFQNNLRQLVVFSQNLVNYREDIQTESSRKFKSNIKNLNSSSHLKLIPEPVYLEIPLMIHLKTFCKMSKAPDSLNTPTYSIKTEEKACQTRFRQTEVRNLLEEINMPQCLTPQSANMESDISLNVRTKATQTVAVPQFEAGYMPACWCALQETKECECRNLEQNNTNTEQKFPTEECEVKNYLSPSPIISNSCQSLFKTNMEGSVCHCEREKLTLEEYNELMEKPNAKLFSLICENKLKCACDLEKSKPSFETPTNVYHLAHPQHKYLDVCIKCRFEPSPLIDADGRVFCPGNCGCCLCPWKPRASPSLEDVFRHSKIKVCKCQNRTGIFGNVSKYGSACSQVSYFDVCPCREKAEAKHLELYGYEMWDQNKKIRQIMPAVLLTDVKQIYPNEKTFKNFSNSLLFKDD